MNNQVQAIIIKQNDYKDHALMLTAFTREYGKLTFIASGAKKETSKNASRILPFTMSECLFDYKEGKTIFRLKSANTIHIYRYLHEDLEASLASGVIGDMVDALTYDIYDYEEVFNILEWAFQSLNEGKRTDLVIGIVLVFLMNHNGISANVDECAICQKQQVVTISARDGGFLCADCANKQHLPHYEPRFLKEFRLLNKANYTHYAILEENITDAHPYITLLLEMLHIHQGIELRSYKVYEKLLPLKEAL